MNKEDKQLLLKDLCARLPYRVKINFRRPDNRQCYTDVLEGVNEVYFYDKTNFDKVVVSVGGMGIYIDDVKPYLRLMSSMTDEEKSFIEDISHGWLYVNESGEIYPIGQMSDSGEFDDAIVPAIEWLNKEMFDYRHLIDKGLALEALKDMYNQN